MLCIIEMGACYQHWLCHINYTCETLNSNDPNQIFNVHDLTTYYLMIISLFFILVNHIYQRKFQIICMNQSDYIVSLQLLLLIMRRLSLGPFISCGPSMYLICQKYYTKSFFFVLIHDNVSNSHNFGTLDYSALAAHCYFRIF